MSNKKLPAIAADQADDALLGQMIALRSSLHRVGLNASDRDILLCLNSWQGAGADRVTQNIRPTRNRLNQGT